MSQIDRPPTKSELALLDAAESRIDVALSELLLAMKGVKDAGISQAVAMAELREAREAVKALRKRLGNPTP